MDNIVYTGSWVTYPIITLTGPYTYAVISHQQTNVIVMLNVALAAGETRILDLTPGAQRLVDEGGNNFFGELGPLSNLVNFNIQPDPEVTGGINAIQVELVGGLPGLSAVTIQYFTRYYAI